MNELAALASMSTPEFSRLFLARIAIRPSEYLKRRQVECARQLLVRSNLPLNHIAYRCGFRRRRTFFRAFKRIVGVTPGNFRAKHRKDRK